MENLYLHNCFLRQGAKRSNAMIPAMLSKIRIFGEIITQDFLEDGEFIPPHLLLETRGKEKHCYDPRDADGSKGRKRQRCGHTHVGQSSKPNSLGAAAHHLYADAARGRKRETTCHLVSETHVGESSKTNSLGPVATDNAGDRAKKHKRCCGGDSDQVPHLSKLLRATELKLKCAGFILKSQSAHDFPAAKLRHSCL